MSPLESAARALCQMDSASSGEEAWQDYIPKVLAVLDAIHEPSDRMREGGAEVLRAYAPRQEMEMLMMDSANIWRYMIDSMRRQA